MTQGHVKTLKVIDEDLVRKSLEAHGKTPKEIVYNKNSRISDYLITSEEYKD